MTTERRVAGPASGGLADLHLYVITALALAYVAAWWSFAVPVPAAAPVAEPAPAAVPQPALQAAVATRKVAARKVAAPTATAKPAARMARKPARRARRLRTRSS